MDQNQRVEQQGPQAGQKPGGSAALVLLALGFGALVAIASLVALAWSGGQGEAPAGKSRRETRRDPETRRRSAADDDDDATIIDIPPAPPVKETSAPAPVAEEKPAPPSPPVPPTPSETASPETELAPAA